MKYFLNKTITFLTVGLLVACDGGSNSTTAINTKGISGAAQQPMEQQHGDIYVEEKWKIYEDSELEKRIKEECRCEEKPEVIKDDGETTYFYRLMQCRSKCGL